MTLRNDLIPYTDADGYIEAALGYPSTNGVLYTSEALIALIRNGEATPADIGAYVAKMFWCMPTPGLLQRTPTNAGGQESVDDYYGLAAAIDEADTPTARGIASLVVKYALKHLGSMDTVNPGRFQWSAFLVRQPTLDACILWAAGDFVGPVLRAIMTFTILWNALFATVVTDTTSWRLQWLQVQIARRHSFSARLASNLWYWRLRNVWGPTGMKAVNSAYFTAQHPLAKWVVDRV